MKKVIIKSTFAVVAVATSCLGAWRAYGAYGNVDNSLLMENLEAVSQGNFLENAWDAATDYVNGLVNPCISTGKTMQFVDCKASESSTSVNIGGGVNVTVPIEGVPVTVGGNTSVGSSSNNTVYTGKQQKKCVDDSWNKQCDRRKQTDCDGHEMGDAAC